MPALELSLPTSLQLAPSAWRRFTVAMLSIHRSCWLGTRCDRSCRFQTHHPFRVEAGDHVLPLRLGTLQAPPVRSGLVSARLTRSNASHEVLVPSAPSVALRLVGGCRPPTSSRFDVGPRFRASLEPRENGDLVPVVLRHRTRRVQSGVWQLRKAPGASTDPRFHPGALPIS